MIIIICGLPGVGKTKVAKNLADKIRKELPSNVWMEGKKTDL